MKSRLVFPLTVIVCAIATVFGWAARSSHRSGADLMSLQTWHDIRLYVYAVAAFIAVRFLLVWLRRDK
jgi:hypothetical protein